MNILNVGESETFFCRRGNDIADDFRSLRDISFFLTESAMPGDYDYDLVKSREGEKLIVG
jgi:hypothetical protein